MGQVQYLRSFCPTHVRVAHSCLKKVRVEGEIPKVHSTLWKWGDSFFYCGDWESTDSPRITPCQLFLHPSLPFYRNLWILKVVRAFRVMVDFQSSPESLGYSQGTIFILAYPFSFVDFDNKCLNVNGVLTSMGILRGEDGYSVRLFYRLP